VLLAFGAFQREGAQIMKTTNVSENVSEFEFFINQYLADHHEVVEDQKRGWDIYWNPKGVEEALKNATGDSVTNRKYVKH
jgi:hypothetical protein